MSTAPAGFQTGFAIRPHLVVEAAHAEDVCTAVADAAARGLPVRVHATGHGLPGAVEGGVLISTRRMDSVGIDPVRRTARIGAGVTWGQVIEAAAPHGLAPLNGSSPSVGAVSCTLGGGDRTEGFHDARTQQRLAGLVSRHDPASLFGELRHQPRRPMSFQAVGSAPMASAAFSASPSRNGTRPAAIAALADMPVASAR